MISKQQLLDSMRHECKIIKHLYTCIPEGGLDYRPTPEQRSMRELLCYMTAMALSPAVFAITKNWDHAPGMGEESKRIDLEKFPEAMDAQIDAIEETFKDVTDEDLGTKEISMPWNTPCMLGEGIMNMCIKAMTAYRMQLFLYVKAAGNKNIGPYECWAGGAPPSQ